MFCEIDVCVELTPEELNRTLSRQQFCDYIDQLIAHESLEMFDEFMDFLLSAVKVGVSNYHVIT